MIRVRYEVPTKATRLGVAVLTKSSTDYLPEGSATGVRLYVDFAPNANSSEGYHTLTASSDRGADMGKHQFQHATWTMLASDQFIEFEIYVDHTKVEWFVNDGAMAMAVNAPQSLMSFSNNSKQGVGLFANATAVSALIEVWSMASIWENQSTHDRPGPL